MPAPRERRLPFWQVLLGLLLLLAGNAAQALSVLPPIGPERARHLLLRTGFGAPPAEVAALAVLTREQAVARVLEPRLQRAAGQPAAFASPPPALVHEAPGQRRMLDEAGQKAARDAERQAAQALRSWWIGEMLAAPTPADALHEHMVLFWHNHFVSSLQKVRSPALMQQQNHLLRQHALGSFAELLHAISKDPAMLIYLDGASSRKDSPNENFAREVMELFTLGEGQYQEQDIREAARAFTGWRVDPESGTFRPRPAQQDNGEKILFGQRGNFDGDAVLDLLLARPQTARFIVRKLWLEFVSPQPDSKRVEQIARQFGQSGHDLRVALRELLLTPEFWHQAGRAELVKSPVDLVIGTLRTLDIPVTERLPLASVLRQLGQDLLAPPNVKGWPGGENWINSNSLLLRKQWLERLLRQAERGETGVALNAWLARFNRADALRQALLALPPVQVEPETMLQPPGITHLRALLQDPAYQLK